MPANTGKKPNLWGRLLCAVVTFAALAFVLHRLNFQDLMRTLHGIRPGFFLGALALFGLLFLPAAARWRLVLRLMGRAAGFFAIVRVSLIGHFFYTVMFGVVGGDAAKSALYARWHRLPLPEVLAAAPLDRLLGFAGLLIFGSVAIALAISSGGFGSGQQIEFGGFSGWAVVFAVAIALIVWRLKRARLDSSAGRFWRAFSTRGKLLFTSPRLALAGVVCGLLVQLALSGVLALNLQAVSHAALPWNQLIWTFPVITIISALPVTVAGLGMREGAALVLLGHYGVSGSDAVAASLLTAAVSVFWAFAGGILLLRGEGG